MGNKRYRQDANKAAQSKSQTMRRKSSLGSTASDPKEQHNAILPELVGEKLRQMNDSSHHSCTDSGSRSQRRSLSRKISQRSSSRSSKVSISVRDELEDKMDRMQASDLPSASSLKKNTDPGEIMPHPKDLHQTLQKETEAADLFVNAVFTRPAQVLIGIEDAIVGMITEMAKAQQQ